MKKSMKILMVFPEIAPFSKTCGMADVGNGLPKALKDCGHDVRLITPQYRVINERKYVLRDVIRLQNIQFSMGEESISIDVKSAFLPGSKVQVYFIDYKPFFFRDGLYSEPKTGKLYEDNDRRFMLFSRGVLETLTRLQWQPDIIHCHHWQTGLIPLLLRTIYKDDPFFQETACFFQVDRWDDEEHFAPDCLQWTGLPPETIKQDLTDEKKCSFLKTGAIYADLVGRGPHFRAGSGKCVLDSVLKKRKEEITDLPLGIDDKEWNPVADNLITAKYSDENPEEKKKNTEALFHRLKVEYSEERPVVSLFKPMISPQGLESVWNVLDEMMKLDILFLIFGWQDENNGFPLKKTVQKYKPRLQVLYSCDEADNHLVEAGTDIKLIPAVADITCISPLVGLKYGSIPVYQQGIPHFESLTPYNSKTGKGIGFRFDHKNGKALVQSLQQAVKAFADPRDRWQLIKNCMHRDLSWSTVTGNYIQSYQKCQIIRQKGRS